MNTERLHLWKPCNSGLNTRVVWETFLRSMNTSPKILVVGGLAALAMLVFFKFAGPVLAIGAALTIAVLAVLVVAGALTTAGAIVGVVAVAGVMIGVATLAAALVGPFCIPFLIVAAPLALIGAVVACFASATA